MVAACAKMAVEIKVIDFGGEPVMISDYECAYACSWAAKRLGMQVEPDTELGQLRETVMSQAEQLAKGDEIDQGLLTLIKNYQIYGTSGDGIRETIRAGMEA